MTAAKAIMEARAAGIQLGVDGDDLVLEASAPPPPAVLELLSRHKTAIVLWLRPGADGWTAEDWQAFFDERAGIAEHDGGMSRINAEIAAYKSCVVEWMNRNPVSSDPDICAWCNKPDRNGHAVVPFGTVSHGHTWLHSECWNAWSEARCEQAREALAGFGVTPCRLGD